MQLKMVHCLQTCYLLYTAWSDSWSVPENQSKYLKILHVNTKYYYFIVVRSIPANTGKVCYLW